MDGMALFTDRSRPSDEGTDAVDAVTPALEAGRGVRATWRYTIASIVFYVVVVSLVNTLLLLSGGAYGLQFLDVALILLAVTSLAALVRYCWFFRNGLGGGLPARTYTLWLLLPAGVLYVLGLLQSHTLWVAALPLWFAANAVAVVVPRRERTWVLALTVPALVLHGMLGMLLGNSGQSAVADTGGFASVALWALMTPLLFVGSIWWWEIVVRLDDSRRTSGELAVVQERLRFAADLHDIQGHHLQVIALKTELAGRLLDTDPEAARVQITEAQQLARTALEDTRALVHGYRAVSLAAEAANAAEVLGAAGISCSVDVDGEGLPAELRTLFGLVIREATTNILRHSEAGAVQLRLECSAARRVLVVRNDGVLGAGAGRSGGSGIDGLRRRFEAVGGRVTARGDDGSFVLTAEAPAGSAPGMAAAGASAGTAVPAPSPTAGDRGRP
ncbi:histidine kinase [Arthrobacter sp. KR32]|uniref:Histidine kinase n=2 Tax=Arthrobacter bussei TaxID=2594179 RepID=A0A7X1NRN6_9MICC|nr:histidine kinase [Arthrobacter bussei]